MLNPSSLICLSVSSLKRRSILERLLTLVLLSIITCSAFANQFYRYKNENGQLVLTQTLPARYADKGYDIINAKGRVVKKVPPALTAEEIKARDDAIEKERLAKLEKERQAAEDEDLKRLYSGPNDAVRVLKRNILDILGVIEIKQNKIQSLEAQIFDEEASAAKLQRKGFSVSEEAIEELQSLKKEIVNTKTDIEDIYLRIDDVAKEFDQKITRLEIITNQQATDYPDVLQLIKQAKEP